MISVSTDEVGAANGGGGGVDPVVGDSVQN